MTFLSAIRVGLALRRLERAGAKPMVRHSQCGNGWVVYVAGRAEPVYEPELVDALERAEAVVAGRSA